jgi:hypothetical protein
MHNTEHCRPVIVLVDALAVPISCGFEAENMLVVPGRAYDVRNEELRHG